MTKKNNITLLLIISVVAACTKTDIEPNIIFKNASVYTVNKKQPWASSVVIQNEKIIFVGSDDDALAFTNKNSQIIDLNKKMILPGFHDIHVHPVHGGVTFLQCNLTDIRGIDNLLSKIKNCAEEKGPNEWVLGGGWAVDNFSAMKLPDKKMLDEIVPDKPVSLKSSDGHSLWANSIALEISNINESTIDPKNGAIERYPNSREPSGLLHEDSAMMLVMDNHPELTNKELIDGLKYSRDEFHRLGITGVQDALLKLDPGDPYFGLDAYNYLDNRNELNLHVVTAMFWNNGQPLKPQLERFKRVREKQKNSKNVKATSIKIWQDGVIKTYTAAMKEPYSDGADLFSDELQISESELFDNFDHSCDHFLIFDGTNIVGSVRIIVMDDKIKLERMAILNEYRTKNYGKLCISQIKEYYSALGFSQIVFLQRKNINSYLFLLLLIVVLLF